MLIRELSAETGVTIDTIRFYEKQGLLDETHFVRTSNGYRHYNQVAVQRLTLIRQAQAAGITLSELRESVDAWESGTISQTDKIAFFRHKVVQIEERIEMLQWMKAYLEQKLDATEADRAFEIPTTAFR